VLGDVDVNDTEAVGHGPVDVRLCAVNLWGCERFFVQGDGEKGWRPTRT
jgi:hypothetical protein